MNTNTIPTQIDAIDSVDAAMSLVNLLRSVSPDSVVEFGGENGLMEVLAIIAERLESVKEYLDNSRGRTR